MARFQDIVTDQSGSAIPGAFITVRDYPSGTLTAITDDLGAPKANPITADGSGAYYFNAPSALYTLEFRLLANEVVRKIREVDLSDTLRTDLIGGSGHVFKWGTSPPAWDGVSDFQAYFLQTQSTFLLNGSLGALFGQRLATYSGGAVSDLTAPVVGAVRGYNQTASSVGRAVEAGGLFVNDNLSYLAQGVGCTSQSNSVHGGRSWGGVHEVHELPETFTATAGQTVFVVPNGFNSVGAVTKNGTLLTVTTQYTAASPNVVLVSGASAGDIIEVHRGDPQNGMIAVESDIFAGPGTDTANPISGNRIGHAIFAYRKDKTITVASHVGTLLALIADPADTANLTVDRGIQFQGKFGIGIDFTASNFVPVNWLIKFGSASGVDASGNIKGAGSITSSGGGIGYATGAGGAVTQATSKATAVTLNKFSGAITLNNAALAANTLVSFTFNNSQIAADDRLSVWVKSGNASIGSYRVAAEGSAAGSRSIVVENKTGGSLSEAIVLGFEVSKDTIS